jgi:signal transduction histidine kinase
VLESKSASYSLIPYFIVNLAGSVRREVSVADKSLNHIGLLRQTFPELSDSEITTLDQATSPRTYPAGSVLCREGEEGKTLYILAEGEVDVFVCADSQQEIRVKTMRPISYFGEMALLGETTRSATIRATTRCRTLEIDQDAFVTVADRNPALLRTLGRQISNHLRNNDRAIIAQLKEKNAALQAAYASLAEQEQLRTEFIATLSHELRTPLTSVQGFLQLINKGVIEGEALRLALDSITRNVEKMVRLIHNLLILYEMHLLSQQPTILTLPELLVTALHDAQVAPVSAGVGYSSPVNMDIAPDLPSLHGDKSGLALAVRSIIENALKFSPNGTPIHIAAYRADDHHVCIAISDEGIGIPADAHERIFEPFYRVERPGANRLFPGLGVGLAIAQFIISRHNGRIELQSEPGQGSTFNIYLPCATTNTVRATWKPTARAAVPLPLN